MKRVFFDTDPGYNCLRIESPNAQGKFLAVLPPSATDTRLMDDSEIPTDRTFRNAWITSNGKIEHDIAKCKVIAHDKRRAMRAAELAPLDDIIATQIPGNNPQQIEVQRQVVRDKYAAMQTAIDSAQDVAAIKAAIGL